MTRPAAECPNGTEEASTPRLNEAGRLRRKKSGIYATAIQKVAIQLLTPSPVFHEVFILRELKRDYVLDTRPAPYYTFFVLERFSNLATCFLMSLWPLRVNKCRIASSVVISFGC